MDEIDELLEERGKQYGSYKMFNSRMAFIMNTLKIHRGEEPEITNEDVDNFFLVLKMLRLQTATDDDSIKDLKAYAKLIRERREKES
jgi:hypothetical protein